MTLRPSLPTHDRGRLADRAHREIRRRILDNEYAPAQQVLEQDLAADLGMSRTPVREALVRLAHERLVELVPRHGMRVVPLSLQDLRDVYEVITALELAAIERLVRMRPDSVTLAALDTALDAMDAATARGRTDAWVRADQQFHGLLLGLCGNPRLVALASTLSDQVHRARLATVRLRASLDPSNREHRAVVEAIGRGSLRDAQRHHARHRARTSREILDILEQTRLGRF